MKQRKLSDYIPVGNNFKQTALFLLVMAGIFILLCSLFFFAEYDHDYHQLFDRKGNLIPDMEMLDFRSYIKGNFIFSIGYWLNVIFLAVGNYTQHRVETKSIYVMRRIPDRWELHRRCLTVPIAALLLGLLLVAVLTGLYAAFYFLHTPKPCIPVQTSFSFWEVFL